MKRGAKRKILAVIILAGIAESSMPHGKLDLIRQIAHPLLNYSRICGIGALITSRPYGVVASMSEEPRDIFVNAVQSGPLAGDLAYQLDGKDSEITQHLRRLAN